MSDIYKYVGAGDFVQGVPARDLTKAEWDALPKELRKRALSLGLYEADSASKPSPTKKEQ